jgi:hypothetical protein
VRDDVADAPVGVCEAFLRGERADEVDQLIPTRRSSSISARYGWATGRDSASMDWSWPIADVLGREAGVLESGVAQSDRSVEDQIESNSNSSA